MILCRGCGSSVLRGNATSIRDSGPIFNSSDYQSVRDNMKTKKLFAATAFAMAALSAGAASATTVNFAGSNANLGSSYDFGDFTVSASASGIAFSSQWGRPSTRSTVSVTKPLKPVASATE